MALLDVNRVLLSLTIELLMDRVGKLVRVLFHPCVGTSALIAHNLIN
jgi:hypothetical protein